MSELKLNTDPYHHHMVCGFMFHISIETGIDQFGGHWKNNAPNPNSFLMEPVKPEYLDLFMDLFNEIKEKQF
jgi:hypothetical protein